jgi:hypothetical protein
MFIIFDTYAGLCNQMYDIQSAINFCIINNIEFSFRYASLRCKNDLTKWYNIDFCNLFDEKFINTSLYKPFKTLTINKENTYHYNSNKRSIEWLDKEKALLPQLDRIEEPYIILKQFWSIYLNYNDIENVYPQLIPCERLFNIYTEVVKNLPEKYNLIHYRYEEDFIQHFKIIDHPKLCDIIDRNNFQNKTLPIYIAAFDIKNIPKKLFTKNLSDYSNLLYKKPEYIKDIEELNFEELAFIDFMIGKKGQQVIGHSKSSFSVILNSSHNTNYYYN